uniref:Uncharacterized protein n=1 Tax=Steinernema glaseri TaxID=37863 RepID=A0A1I8AHQ2_9BILA
MWPRGAMDNASVYGTEDCSSDIPLAQSRLLYSETRAYVAKVEEDAIAPGCAAIDIAIGEDGACSANRTSRKGDVLAHRGGGETGAEDLANDLAETDRDLAADSHAFLSSSATVWPELVTYWFLDSLKC